MKHASMAAAFVLMALGVVGAAPAQRPQPPIGVVLNGQRLAVSPPPRFYQYHLLVPVRQIIEALGLDFIQSGSEVTTHAGYKTVTLTIGSTRAEVDGRYFSLDTAPVEIADRSHCPRQPARTAVHTARTHAPRCVPTYTLYAPLRFFTDLLGAQASYDRASNTVTIVAQLVGVSGDGIIDLGNAGVEQVGAVTAVDLDSDPPTITITYNASVRTVQVVPNAQITLQDVNADVTVPGELSDVWPGDFAQLFGSDREHADRIVDAYGSRVGTIAAVGQDEAVLDDGHVLVPERTTLVSIDGVPGTIAQAQVGDRAIVRYNVVSGEIREILLGRNIAAASPAPGAPRITDVETDATRPLRARELLTVTAHGTPGGAATFDIGPYVTGLAMNEQSSGVYSGVYQVPDGANFADVPVIVHLRVAGADAAPVQAAQTVSASSSPPGIGDVAPDDGATVNGDRPAIYATFVSDAVPVDPSSVVMWVDGRDVTSDTVRNARFIEYTPDIDYPPGPVQVTVKVADFAGNITTKSWKFSVSGSTGSTGSQ